MHPEAALIPSLAIFVATVWAFLQDLVSMYVAIPVTVVVLLAVLNWKRRRAEEQWR